MHLPKYLSEKVAYSKQRPHRIEALADGVYAIVMTLLVLDIRIPLQEMTTEQGMWEALLDTTPKILTFILSFSALGNFWSIFTNQFNYIHTANRNENIIAIIYLMIVSLLPFSTSFLSEHLWSRVAVGFYTFNIILILLLNSLHWLYSYHNCFTHLEGDQDIIIHKTIIRRSKFAIIGFLIVACFCFYSSYLALSGTILLQFIFTFSGFIETRKFSLRKKTGTDGPAC